jgi:hypothetical protein
MPFSAAKFSDMQFELSLMAEEGALPADVAARIQQKLVDRFDLAETFQMDNSSSDYWDNTLRYGLGLQCVARAPRSCCSSSPHCRFDGACNSYIPQIIQRLAACR